MTKSELKALADRFPNHWDRHYVANKLRMDPLYGAIAETLRGSQLPLLDLGCGLGLLAFFLRSTGNSVPIQGLDYDDRKIRTANQVAANSGYANLEFLHHDARSGLPDHHGDVSILDILQFFTSAEQENLLTLAASRIAPGGKLIVRSGLQDESWRFKITVAGDLVAKASFWMKAAPTHYPTADDFQRILSPFGRVEISPLWGGTPFNNHLIVLHFGQDR